jgi:hypothetical protein
MRLPVLRRVARRVYVAKGILPAEERTAGM